jgi:hypothetical protein
MKKHVGYFSIDASGGLCFHDGVDSNPEHIAKVLTEGVTGGPYTVRKAYILMENENESNDNIS